jgi:hypothetical protein
MRNRAICLVVVSTVFFATAGFLHAQSGSQGKVVVTVQDPSGAVVKGAQLELRDLSTNDVRKADTEENGTHTFVGLLIGKYSLSVSKDGFETQVFDSVVVQAAQATDVRSALKVGAASITMEVTETATPLITTDSSIGTTIDLKQIEQLPLNGRNLTGLANLVPGYNGTWNGLPVIAQGGNIDGVIGAPSRSKYEGNAEPATQPRVEDIEEMTVQTGQLDLDQGFGQANMQINFVTRRGTNKYHGRAFGDFRNAALNANSWFNDAVGQRRPHFIKNEFGGSVGGPILRDKLFFFFDLSVSKQPGSNVNTQPVFTSAAEAGNFSYTDTNGAQQTVNLLTIAQNNGLPTSNATIGAQLTLINKNLASGKLSSTSDPNIQNVTWTSPAPITIYYPTLRIDYNLSQKYHFGFAFNETRETDLGAQAPPLPGPDFANRGAGNYFKDYTASFNFDWLISPTLTNQFRGGFLYNDSWFANNVGNFYKQLVPQTAFATNPATFAPIANSGLTYVLPVNQYYPLINASDTLSWQHGAHAVKFGFSFYREQDHYWDAPTGFPGVSLGLVSGDPALQAFTAPGALPNASSQTLGEAEAEYASLVGRISGVGGQWSIDAHTGQYLQNKAKAFNLDERQQAWGLFIQDSFRLRQNLTLNYGLRWDFTGDDYDLQGGYFGAGITGAYGPSGVGNLFNPGSLKGDMNPALVARQHQYQPWNVSPQPSLGVAWDPAGNGKTVIRGGFSLRKYTEPEQYFWDAATNANFGHYQQYSLNPSTLTGTGLFTPGSLQLNGVTFQDFLPSSAPAYLTNPVTFQKTFQQSDATFTGNAFAVGIDPKIAQPYTESWNFGVQHELSKNNALELRYVGNRSVRQWTLQNINEVNVFQSGATGFLTNFQTAQANLKACLADTNCAKNPSFANNGLPGQASMPFFDAAFAGESSGPDGKLADYTNSSFAQILQNGAVGSLASQMNSGLGGNAPYFCNLVGASFVPCANFGFTGAGAGYPINYFQANPYGNGSFLGAQVMRASGYATYHALQADFRQKAWHGMQFDMNYTWSHSLGTQPTPVPSSSNGAEWLGQQNQFSLRKQRLSYVPAFDVRHVLHVSGTLDLPFGKGRKFLNRGGVVDKAVGGWSMGTILTYRSGNPFQLVGGFQTFNDYGDGGVTLNGVTVSQLQSSVGVHRTTGQPGLVDIVDPKYLVQGAGANTSFIKPNTAPGTFGQIPFLYGPHGFYDDLALTKAVSLTERVKFSLQAEFLNAFNHPVFGNPVNGNNGVQSQSFGIASGPGGDFGRQIEFRANIEF